MAGFDEFDPSRLHLDPEAVLRLRQSIDEKQKTVGDPLMSKHEASLWLGIGRAQLEKLQAEGVVPYIRIGNTIKYRRSSLQRWLDEIEVFPEVINGRIIPTHQPGDRGGSTHIARHNREPVQLIKGI